MTDFCNLLFLNTFLEHTVKTLCIVLNFGPRLAQQKNLHLFSIRWSFFFRLPINYPASLFFLVSLGFSKSASLNISYTALLRSCTWCLSTSWAWHRVIPLALLSTHSPLLQRCCLQRWLVPSASLSSGCSCRYHQTSVNLWISWRAKCSGGWQSLPTTTHQVPPALHPGVHNHRCRWSGGSPGPTLVLPGAWLPCCPDLMPWLACVPTEPVLRLNRSTQDYEVIADKESSRKNCVKISSTLPKHARDDTAPFQSLCSL